MTTAIRFHLVRASALLALAGLATTAEQPAVRALLQPVSDRKAAPEFALKDSSGNVIRLTNYRNKVVLLNFWATWCTGCKKEIPWFSEFQKTYGARDLAVVGVSMDDEGWRVVSPFLTQTRVGYRMLLGDSPTALEYGVENLPATFLIDRQGRMAAAYSDGLLDKNDVEANIKALLSRQ